MGRLIAASKYLTIPFVGLGLSALSSASLPSRGSEVKTTEADSATGRSPASSSGIFGGGDRSSGPGLGLAMVCSVRVISFLWCLKLTCSFGVSEALRRGSAKG